MEQSSIPANAIGILRVSSQKQGLSGDSPKDQKEQIEPKVKILNAKVIKWFTFIASASGDIQPCQEAINYCKENQGKIKYAFVKSIDRLTRGGSYSYDHLKMQLTRYGVQLLDVQGVIGEQTVNTLGHLDVNYSWSTYNPSRVAELLVAERGKDEVRDILSRMIGAEIRYTRMGYAVRAAPPGFANVQEDTPHGKRTIRQPHPIEAPWFIRMFELRVQGNLTDDQIVVEVNNLGFKTRKLRVHDPNNKTQIVGYKGEQPLTVKKLRGYIQSPIYAGVNTEKWLNGQPIKTLFPGLVSIETFNKANRGKITIIDDSDSVRVFKGKTPEWLIKKQKKNPAYPYRQYVVCPVCRRPLLGSAPRNKSGNHIPRYHCSRKHKYWSINRTIFDETITKFTDGVEFSDLFREKLNVAVLGEWDKRAKQVSNDTVNLNTRLIQIEHEIQEIKEKIKMLFTRETISLMEDDIVTLKNERADLIVKRDKKEDEQVSIDILANYTSYYMEHIQDLLFGSLDPFQNAAMFGLMFRESPTYNNLIDGTPNLAPVFSLKKAFEKSETELVHLA